MFIFTMVGVLAVIGLWYCFTQIRKFYKKKIDSLRGIVVQLDIQRKILAISILSPMEGKTEVCLGTFESEKPLSLIIPAVIQRDICVECSICYGQEQKLLCEYIRSDAFDADRLNTFLDKYIKHNFPQWNLCLPK